MIGRLYYLKVVWGGVNFITKSHLEKIIFVDQSWIWPLTISLFMMLDMLWKSIVLSNFLRKEFGRSKGTNFDLFMFEKRLPSLQGMGKVDFKEWIKADFREWS